VIDGNLTAIFLTCRAYLRHVAEVGDGSLVLIASTAGLFGEAGNADYGAAKAAIAYGLGLSLKNEIVRSAPRGRVNVVAAGWTISPMTEATLDEDRVRLVTATMPLKKVATVEDIAAAIVWIVSLAAGHSPARSSPSPAGWRGGCSPPLRPSAWRAWGSNRETAAETEPLRGIYLPWKQRGPIRAAWRPCSDGLGRVSRVAPITSTSGFLARRHAPSSPAHGRHIQPSHHRPRLRRTPRRGRLLTTHFGLDRTVVVLPSNDEGRNLH
jgi:hypothetical protein